MLTKKSIWVTNDGVSKPFGELEDTHLANIMLFVHEINHLDCDAIMKVCADILKERGIDEEFVKMTQIPHKDKDGHWACWDYKTKQHKKLQKEI